MTKINISQVLGLPELIQSVKDQIDDLQGLTSGGGVLSGELTIEGGATVSGNLSIVGSNFYFDNENAMIGVNIVTPESSIHIKSFSGDVTVNVSGSGSSVSFRLDNGLYLSALQNSGQDVTMHNYYTGGGGAIQTAANSFVASSIEAFGEKLNVPLVINECSIVDFSRWVSEGKSAIIDKTPTGEYAGLRINAVANSTSNAKTFDVSAAWGLNSQGGLTYDHDNSMELSGVYLSTEHSGAYIVTNLVNRSSERVLVGGITKRFFK